MDKKNIFYIFIIALLILLSGYLFGRTSIHDTGNTATKVGRELNQAVIQQSRITTQISDSIDTNKELRELSEQASDTNKRITESNRDIQKEVTGIRETVESTAKGITESDKLISDCQSILRQVREAGNKEKK